MSAIGIAKSKRRCWDGHVATLHHMSASRILPQQAAACIETTAYDAVKIALPVNARRDEEDGMSPDH